MDKPTKTGADSPLLRGYAPVQGVADELFDRDGNMRPVWKKFVATLSNLSEEELRAKFERGRQYLRDAGVYFRQYSQDPLNEREWPLANIPVLLHDSEWDEICAGLSQRAELLERVMADLYGPATLLRDGHLPPRLITENSHWKRPMVGVEPRGGHYLHFLAFEIGRSPDGSWLVLGDRTQAPSGAGFALENRMAMRRIFPEDYPRAYTHRIAGFFEGFRNALQKLAGDGRSEPHQFGLLTPGRANDAFFEHLYIARYLGLLLLEGEDILVQNGQAMVRTIEGPVPLGLLWRRIDASFADPLEYNPESWIGVPGLMDAVRSGNLAMVNALGSGVLETRALMAFLPRISEVLTGQTLALPNIATWWCGDDSARAYVRDNMDRMLIAPALSGDLPFDSNSETVRGAEPEIRQLLDDPAPDLVGQEAISLSTTPAWIDGEDGPRLTPCPTTIRVFAARTERGWTFMQGGYARIGPPGDATALAMQRGGSVSDVLIISDDRVPDTASTKASPDPSGHRSVRTEAVALPARAADNLFWLGRYMVRFEDVARLLRAYNLRLATTDSDDDPILASIADYLEPMGVDATQAIPDGLIDRLQAAHNCAGRIRDRFSTDAWFALNDLIRTTRQMSETATPGDDAARAMSVLLRKTAGFSGVVVENMYRFYGWRFLNIGRSMERCDTLAAILEHFADPAAPEGALDIALEVGDSTMAHRRRYALEPTRDTVVDLLAHDAGNPRSLLFQLREMQEFAEGMPGANRTARPTPLVRELLPLRTRLEVELPSDLTPAGLAEVREALARMSDRLSEAHLR
ncbi:circularly permuted type 2 ATP-grasp protein [Pseudooceanicola onchidii]|uniref:circularly permuted type 2 ATP-grasp protein n=1 Tax=Pseudooceanicola onchidii TaxID=2562279 RepID=UPI0010AB235B|nr:circularly permuted type 2 ATP-grasp protein [Pseudooceanicola onchidii]